MGDATFTDADGIDIFYRAWLPEIEARGAVVVAHGASEHSGRYERFARSLVESRWAVYAIDHRGHGRSSDQVGVGRLGPRGLDGVLDDIGALISIAGDAVGDRPVVLFGHSMGSVFAQAFMVRDPGRVVGYVLSGCPGAPVDGSEEMVESLRSMVEAGSGDDEMAILGRFNQAFEPARTPFDWLSRDDAEVDAYIADPLCGDTNPLTVAYVAAMLEAVGSSMSPAAVASVDTAIPVLLVTGEDDPVSQNAARVRMLEQSLSAGGREVTAYYYADARHEVLNETNRGEVTAGIVNWLDIVAMRCSA